MAVIEVPLVAIADHVTVVFFMPVTVVDQVFDQISL